ncbi:hypothetical protein BA177_09185 [Woeseia oceani]|uniref:Uncharacterized protein n=2 Tax=Woeseia oceani TaxID=1548547 RepID=A0A193LFW5_9GAMM|nr:hypothetical protein BA177_09185 [Woeseia oceani]
MLSHIGDSQRNQVEKLMQDLNEKHRPSDIPLSEATIPTRLADIRARCQDLLADEGELALTLDDPGAPPAHGAYNPYNHS